MKRLLRHALRIAITAGPIITGVVVATALSHHSFAMYDMTKTIKFTGVLTGFVSQANHAEIHFVPLGADGKPSRGPDGQPISWGVEMGGAAAMAQQGISVNTFPIRVSASAWMRWNR